MSRTVDQKVVQMQFDNQGFEQNARQTMSTLDKLKAALKFDGANKGIEELNKSVKGIDFTQPEIMATKAGFHIQDVFLKVSNVLEYQIARKIINMSEQVAKSLTFDQVNAGFHEYELKMGSIQTIMASTGEKIEVVNKYLNDLNAYSDKTIYSFSDMTQNIGKFTNAGVKLKDAVAAIQGVANVAAVSGANANEASRAMYNFAQALSAGYVKLIDWKSIENANMATVEFKDTLLQTAAAMGTAEQKGDGMYKILTKNAQGKTMDGLVSSTKNFNDSLAHQWMTTEVLNQTLEIYSKDVRTMTEAEKEAYEAKLKSKGFTDEQIKQFEELGIKATKAASEVKTFSQLMDTVKESIGSGWAMSFEHVIGNFEEAKALFTEINDAIGVQLAKLDNRRNTLLNNWKEKGGRDALIQSFRNIAESIGQVIKVAKQLWYDLFPPLTSQKLVEFTKGFEQFTRSLIMNDETAQKLRETLHYLLTPVKILIELIKIAFSLIGPIYNILVPLVRIIFSFVSALTRTAIVLGTAVAESKAFQTILNSIKTIAKTVYETIKSLATTIGTSFVKAINDSNSGLNKFLQVLGFIGKVSLSAIVSALNAIANFKFSDVTDGLHNMYNRLKDFVSGLKDMAQNSKAISVLVTVIEKLKSAYEFLHEAFAAFMTSMSEGIDKVHNFSEFLTLLKDSLENAFRPLLNFFKDKIFGESGNIFDNLKKSFSGFIDTILEGAQKIPWAKVLLIAFCLGLAAAVLQLVMAISKFSTLAAALGESIRIVNETVKRFTTIRNRLIELKEIAVFVAAITASIGILASLPKDDLLRATAVLASVAGGLMILAEVMMFINKKAVLKPAVTSQLFASLAGLAVGAAILTAAVIALSELKKTISELLPYIAELGIVMLELIAAISVLSIIGKKLSLSLSAFSALSLIAFAGSVYLLCKALRELEDINFADINGLVKVLISVLGGFAVITALTKKLGFWSFASLIAIMIGLKNLAPTIKELATMTITDDVKHILELVTQIITVVGIVSAITTVCSSIVNILNPKKALMKRANSLLGDFSRTLLAIGISTSLMVVAITKLISTIDKLKHPERIKMSLIAAGLIIAALGVFIVKVSQGGKIFTTHKGSMLKFAAGVALLSATILPLTLCVEELAKFGDDDKKSNALLKAGAIIGGLVVCIGILAKLSSAAAGVSFKTLLTIFGGVTAIIGEMIIMATLIEDNKDGFGDAFGVLLATLIVLDGALGFLSLMKFDAVSTGPIVAFTAALAALFGGMLLAAGLLKDEDTDRLGRICVGFIGTAIGLAGSLVILSKAAIGISWAPILAFAGLLATFAGSFIAISKTISTINLDEMEKVFWGFVGIIGVLAAASYALATVSAGGEIAVILLSMAGSIVAFAGAMKLIEDLDAVYIDQVLTNFVATITSLAALAGIIGVLDYVYGIGAAIQAAALAMGAFAAGVGILAGGIGALTAGIGYLFKELDEHLIPALISLGVNADTIKTGIESLADAISNALGTITAEVDKCIVLTAEGISLGLQSISQTIAASVQQDCEVIAAGILTISRSVGQGLSIIIAEVAVALGEGIVTCGEIIAAGVDDIWNAFVTGTTEKIPQINQYGVDSGTEFSMGLESTAGLVLVAAELVMGKLLGCLNGFNGLLYNMGSNLFRSLLSGFGSGENVEYTEETVENVVYGANNKVSAVLKEQQASDAKYAKQASDRAKHEQAALTEYWKKNNKERSKSTEQLYMTVEKESASTEFNLKTIWHSFFDDIGSNAGTVSSGITSVLNTLKEKGKEGYEAITSWLDPSTWAGDFGNFETMMEKMGLNVEDVTEKITNAGTAMEGVGTSASKGAKGVKEAADEVSSFVEKMESSFNIFEEFKLGDDDEENPLTGDQLLHNMQSNIDGMTQWANEMVSIAGKMSEGLYQKLADMGPEGYKYVHAFASMTEEQLMQVNQLYAQSLIIPTTVTAQIYQGMATASSNAYTGFVNGLNIPAMQTQGIAMATTFLSGINSGLGITSYSTKMFDTGTASAEGLAKGVEDGTQTSVIPTVTTTGEAAVNQADTSMGVEAMMPVGENAAAGIAAGIEKNQKAVIDEITALCKEAKDTANKTLDINSPSKVFAKIGSSIDEGLAKGISDNTGMVNGSVEKMAKSTIDNMSDAIATIQSVVSSDMDVEPVIRPVVDLSNVQNGGRTINSLMGKMFGNSVNMPAARFMSNSETVNMSDNSDVVSAINSLKSDVNALSQSISNIKMVLDTGTLVGAMTPAVDKRLGVRKMYAERGI